MFCNNCNREVLIPHDCPLKFLEQAHDIVVGAALDMKFPNTDKDWLIKKAEQEDGCDVSVGGHYNNWVQFKVPENIDSNANCNYKYSFHPPAKAKFNDILICKRCGSVVLSLEEPWNDYWYWCLHCGPQKAISIYDN